MTTYGDVRGRVLRLLKDETGSQFSSELVYDSVLAAHRAILPWVPKFQTATYTSSGSDVFALPSDIYRIESVQDDSGVFLAKATMAPSIQNTSLRKNVWIDYPTNHISFVSEVPAGDNFTVYYQAYWTEPSSGSDSLIEVPRHAEVGLVYYACAHTLLSKSTAAASLRQFNNKVDSGTPTDNPVKDMVELFMARFHQEMKTMPSFTRATQ